jgi:pyruvate dehydrogenase E1 component
VKTAVASGERTPVALYREAENWASWLAAWMVFWANNKPANKGSKPKIGGHQASALSSASILAAYYLHIRRPQDRIAVKPHAAPVLYALLYMMGKLSRHDVENLREFGGPAAYPVQHDYPGLIDYSTSIEGIGCAAVIEDAYEALVQKAQFGKRIDTRYEAVVGDGELTELQIGGALYEAGRRRLSNVCWWIDLNRQSLDRVLEDSPGGGTAGWARRLFRANGWHTIDLRWGSYARAVFAGSGGAELRRRVESLPDAHFQSLLLLHPAVVRKALAGIRGDEDEWIAAYLDEFANSAPSENRCALLETLSDDELKATIEDLGGHDAEALIAAHEEALTITDRPTAILCHTIKGRLMPGWAAHPENHGAVLTAERMDVLRSRLSFPDGDPFARPPADSKLAQFLERRASELFPPETRIAVAYPSELLPKWQEIRTPLSGARSTSAVFGNLNLTYLRTALGKYMAFVAPDVGLTTHLGGVIHATGTFDAEPPADLLRFLRERHQQAFAWRLVSSGQFHSIAINEGLAALLAFAFGRTKYAVEGKEQLIPIVTIYDVFWKHAYTQLYYALYDRARFIAVGTPSGTSLSRESGTHQSVQTPAIFMALPNIIYYEPAFAYDMKVLYLWAVEQLTGNDGESVYLRLTTQEIEQPEITDSPALREQVIRGGYWFINRRGEPGYEPVRNVGHIFATGHTIVEAIRASEALRREGIFANVCNVTSWERLKRDWEAYWLAPDVGDDPARSYHLNDLIPDDEVSVPAVVVGDFTPQVADWVGNALGKQITVLGPRGFSQTGSLESVRKLHGIDATAVADQLRQAIRLRNLLEFQAGR